MVRVLLNEIMTGDTKVEQKTTEQSLNDIEMYCLTIFEAKLGEPRIHDISEVKEVGDALVELKTKTKDYKQVTTEQKRIDEKLDNIERSCLKILNQKLEEKRSHDITEVTEVAAAVKAVFEGLNTYRGKSQKK